MILFHGSRTPNITTLKSFGDGEKPLIYFFSKRENTLIYLCNAVERFCQQTGFNFQGKYATWGPYGFDSDGTLCWSEYYPNALWETFGEAEGYVYKVDTCAQKHKYIPTAYVSDVPVEVLECEIIPDVYQEILKMESEGKLRISRYEDMSEGRKNWLQKTMKEQYAYPEISPDYKYFLENKFDFLKSHK